MSTDNKEGKCAANRAANLEPGIVNFIDVPADKAQIKCAESASLTMCSSWA